MDKGRSIERGTVYRVAPDAADLVPAFWVELNRIDPGIAGMELVNGPYAETLWKALDPSKHGSRVGTEEEGEMLLNVMDHLMHMLDMRAPAELGFGPRRDDPNDFGWWPRAELREERQID